MKCLVVSHSSGMAGAEKSLLAIVSELARQGNDVEVWLPDNGPLKDCLLQIERVQVEIVSNHWWLSRRGGPLVGSIRLLQVFFDSLLHWWKLRGSDFDVVLVNSIVAPAAIFAASRVGIPVVTAIRESFRTNPTLRGVVPRDVIASLVSRHSEKVVCVSDYVAAQYGYASVVIPPPISSLVPIENFTASGVIDGDRSLRLVMMGTIGGDKGQSDAVEAVASAIAKGARVELDLFGSGHASELSKIDDLIRQLGVGALVRRNPETRDVAGALEAADVSLVLSRNEAFGRVTVEALLTGTPVVGFDCGGTSEIIGLHGGGVLVPPSSESLSQVLVELSNNGSVVESLRFDAQRAGRFWSEIRPEEDVVEVLSGTVATRVD